jgi:hypothetical protein
MHFVLRMRDEATELLRKHNDATSRVGAAYAAATRQIEGFRESLRQSVKGVTSLTGAVRIAGADVAEGSALRPWITASGDLARDVETARKVVREQTASTIADVRPTRVRQGRTVDQADDGGQGGSGSGVLRRRMLEDRAAADAATFLAEIVARGAVGSPGRQAPAADLPGAADPGARRDHLISGLERETSLPAPYGRAAARAFQLPDWGAMGELKAAIDATLRNQGILTGNAPRIVFAQPDDDQLKEALERRRSAAASERSIETSMPASRAFGAEAVTPGGDALSSAESTARRNRESLPQPTFGDSPFATVFATGRREMVAEMSETFASLWREMRKAIMQSMERPAIERDKRNEESVLKQLKLELSRLAPAAREIKEAATDRGAWLQENRDVVVEPGESRRLAGAVVPPGIGLGRRDGNSVGAAFSDVATDWRAYGNGIANALGATDQALTGILMQTRDWRSAMHSLINSVVGDFARIAIRQNVTGPLAEAVFGGGGNGGDAGLLGRAFGWITSLFAGGGIMTDHGPLPLRAYASGGIATSPQLALFGEGSTPEAYVPVPNGRIPVTLRGNTGIGSIATNIVINVAGGGGSSDLGVGSDPAEQARNIGALVSAAFNRNLAEQMRPGGLLNPAGYLGNGLVH